MNADATLEMPFVASLPKREAKQVRTLWEQIGELKIILTDERELLPMSVVHTLAGVSRQRVSELVKAGRLERVDVGPLSFVTKASVMPYVESQRKAGRPWPSTVSLSSVKDMHRNLRKK